MNNPDISPVGFGATDHPHATFERRRGVWWLLVGGLLIIGGAAGIALFVWQMVAPSAEPVDDAVAAGRVGALSGPPATDAAFSVADAGRYTVWIDTGGPFSSSARDVIIGATNCEATFADGTTTSFRGAVQGSRVETGDFATIGTFEAPAGATDVTCKSEPFGSRIQRDQLEKERSFYVTSGSAASGWAWSIALFIGIPSLLLGLLAAGRGWSGSLKLRR